MPYTRNQDVRIYYEVEGQGPPLVLAYGLLGSVVLWRDTGYIDQLTASVTVIAFDARGHGLSDKPHDPEAYDRRRMAGDVVAVLDDLGISKAHYWGYSMGGLTGFVMAKHFPHRLLSLVLGGAAPFQPPEPAAPNPMLELWQLGVEQGADAVTRRIEEFVGPVPIPFQTCLQSVDFEAMVAYHTCRKPGLEAEAAQIQVRCLFYAGDADEEPHRYGQQAARTLPGSRFLSLPGRNHLTASDAAELLVPEVLAFLEAVPA